MLKEGYTHVVDADLQAYFDTIPHERLMARVEERVSDGRVLDLIRGWLKADILHGLERWTPIEGTPQGAVISPLLANIYLDPLDRLMAAHGYPMVRYADDFVILARSHAEAEAALALVKAWVTANGLTLHPEKTRIANCRKKGNGFEFLGYRFERGRRHVRKKSLDKLKGRSGAGKSTLLGLLHAQRPGDVALVPQASALVKPLSVFHNVYMGRLDRHSTAYNLRNLVWPAAGKGWPRCAACLASVGLEDEIFSAAGALSGGQQQRTSVARALYNGRPILIGDEPVSALDRVQGSDVLSLLKAPPPDRRAGPARRAPCARACRSHRRAGARAARSSTSNPASSRPTTSCGTSEASREPPRVRQHQPAVPDQRLALPGGRRHRDHGPEPVGGDAPPSARHLAPGCPLHRGEKDGRIERSVIREMGTLGLIGADLPEAHGGLGQPSMTAGLIIEALAYGDFNAAYVQLLASLNGQVLARHAAPELARHWIARLVAGEAIIALALTEPRGGSDAGNLMLSARRHGDSYILRGEKSSISMADQAADAAIVFARTGTPADGPRGVTAFLVPMEAKGVSTTRFSDLGSNAVGRGSIFFDDVMIPETHRLAGEGMGEMAQGPGVRADR